MAPVSYDTPRRSARVFFKTRVAVEGKNRDNRKFKEDSETIVVNAHGGLLYLNQPLEMEGMLTLKHPLSEEEQECRVVYLGETSEKGQRIGVEFLSPAPRFWGVEFTADDPGSSDGHVH